MNSSFTGSARRLQRVSVGVFSVLLVLLLFCLFQRNYYIKAFSDPHNWLQYARNIREQFWTSRWPVLYPAVLRLLDMLLGPFYVFWANAAFIAMNFLLFGAVTFSGLQRMSRWGRLSVAVTSVALAAGVDPALLVELLNPYRDPLAHVFLAASLWLFVLSLYRDSRSFVYPFGAGLLLGLASSTREPSILMIVPYGLFLGIWGVRKRVDTRMAVNLVLRLFAGLFIGLLPLLAQTALATGQVYLPPQSVREGVLLPGFRKQVWFRNFLAAVSYYGKKGSIFMALFLLFGIARGVMRKELSTLLVGLAGMLYCSLYLNYRVFVRRYFLLPIMLWAPLVSYGIDGLGVWILKGKQGHARWRVWRVVVLCAVGCWVGYRMLTAPPPRLSFRIPEARAFERDWGRRFSFRDLVVCPRNLCEVLACFSPAESMPIEWMVPASDYYGESFREVVSAKWNAGGQVFCVDLPGLGDRNLDIYFVKRFFDVLPVDYIPLEQYQLSPFGGGGGAQLWLLRPCSNLEYRHTFPIVPSGAILRVCVGINRNADGVVGSPILYFDEQEPGFPLSAGTSYLAIPQELWGRSMQVVVTSPAPFTLTEPLTLVDPKESLTLDFGVLSTRYHDYLLSDDFFKKDFGQAGARVVEHRGSITLPTPWTLGTQFQIKLHLRGRSFRGQDRVKVQVELTGEAPHVFDVRTGEHFRTYIPHCTGVVTGSYGKLDLRVVDEEACLEIDRMWLVPLGGGP